MFRRISSIMNTVASRLLLTGKRGNTLQASERLKEKGKSKVTFSNTAIVVSKSLPCDCQRINADSMRRSRRIESWLTRAHAEKFPWTRVRPRAALNLATGTAIGLSIVALKVPSSVTMARDIRCRCYGSQVWRREKRTCDQSVSKLAV